MEKNHSMAKKSTKNDEEMTLTERERSRSPSPNSLPNPMLRPVARMKRFVICGRGMIMSIKGRGPSVATCSLLHKRQAPRWPIIPQFAKNEVERLNRWEGATVIVC